MFPLIWSNYEWTKCIDSNVASSQFNKKITPLFPFFRTMEFPLEVSTYYCPQRYVNNYVQLLTASCVFFNCPKLRHTSIDIAMTVSITSQLQEAINILTGSSVYQGIAGYNNNNTNNNVFM